MPSATGGKPVRSGRASAMASEVDAPAQAGAVDDKVLKQEPAQPRIGDRGGEVGVRTGTWGEGIDGQGPQRIEDGTMVAR